MESVAGTYRLRPATLNQDAPLGSAGDELLSGTLMLGPATAWGLQVRVDPLGIVGPQDVGMDGTFGIEQADSLVFTPSVELICCPRDTDGDGFVDVVDTVRTFTGWLSGDRLTVRLHRTGLIFER